MFDAKDHLRKVRDHMEDQNSSIEMPRARPSRRQQEDNVVVVLDNPDKLLMSTEWTEPNQVHLTGVLADHIRNHMWTNESGLTELTKILVDVMRARNLIYRIPAEPRTIEDYFNSLRDYVTSLERMKSFVEDYRG